MGSTWTLTSGFQTGTRWRRGLGKRCREEVQNGTSVDSRETEKLMMAGRGLRPQLRKTEDTPLSAEGATHLRASFPLFLPH